MASPPSLAVSKPQRTIVNPASSAAIAGRHGTREIFSPICGVVARTVSRNRRSRAG